jgi:hypothetical protein
MVSGARNLPKVIRQSARAHIKLFFVIIIAIVVVAAVGDENSQ